MITGDYNLNDVNWDNDDQSFSINGYHRPDFKQVIYRLNNLVQYLNFKQKFNNIYSKSYSLDLCFCNSELISLEELKKDDYLLKSDSHHIPYY